MNDIALALMNSLSTWSVEDDVEGNCFPAFGLSDTQTPGDLHVSAETWLTQLFCARMCHDLVGPAGAVNAGVEFVTSSGVDAEALSLIGTSARQVTGRLAYLRFVFGTSACSGRPLTIAEARSLAELPVVSGRAALDWRMDLFSDPTKPVFSRESLRVLLGYIQACSDILRRGGVIQVSGIAKPLSRLITIVADGDGTPVDDELVLALQGHVDIADLTPRLIYAHIVSQLPTALAIETTIRRAADDRLEITVECPKRCPGVS